MRALLEFIVRGRTTATLIAAGCAITFLVPLVQPLCVVTGVIVGLVTLRHGFYDGLFVLAGTTGLFVLFVTFLVGVHPPFGPLVWFVAVILLMSWSWSWIMASALRHTNAQGYALMVGALAGVLAVLVIPLFMSDSAQWWQQFFTVLGDNLRLHTAGANPTFLDQLIEVFRSRASVMTGIVVSGVILMSIVMLLAARWWHAKLDNPGGFAREFRQLRINRWVSVMILITLLITYVAGGVVSAFGAEIYSIVRVLFVFQGLAVIHALVAQTGVWSGWLLFMYVMVVFAPQMALILATTGFLDTWFDFRKRVRSRTT